MGARGGPGISPFWDSKREAWGVGIGCCSFYPIYVTVQPGKLRPKELRTKSIYMKGLNITVWFRQDSLEHLTPNPSSGAGVKGWGGQTQQDP